MERPNNGYPTIEEFNYLSRVLKENNGIEVQIDQNTLVANYLSTKLPYEACKSNLVTVLPSFTGVCLEDNKESIEIPSLTALKA